MLQYQKIRCAEANEINECGKIPSVCRDERGRQMQTFLNEFRIKSKRRSRAINIFSIVQLLLDIVRQTITGEKRREKKVPVTRSDKISTGLWEIYSVSIADTNPNSAIFISTNKN